MEMHVDQAGENGQTLRVNLLAAGGQLGADGGDAALFHCDIVGFGPSDGAVAENHRSRMRGLHRYLTGTAGDSNT